MKLTCYGKEIIKLTAAAVAAVQCHAGVQMILVKDKKPVAVVVVADNPTPTAKYAAEELVWHLKHATGATISIAPESKAMSVSGTRIYIGVTDAARKVGIDIEGLAPDEFVVRNVQSHLYIVGREDAEGNPLDAKNNLRGTLFGVYEVLNRYLGVRWLWPGEMGVHVVPQDNFEMPVDVALQQRPRLRFRAFYWYHIRRNQTAEIERLAFSRKGMDNYRHDLSVFLARQRTGFTERKPYIGHKFSGWWNKYGKEHPEWFMLRKDGTRGTPKGALPKAHRHTAMCVSNPELHRFIVEKDWNGNNNLCLGEVDRHGVCLCPGCRAWDGPQVKDPPEFARSAYTPIMTSDRYARFWKTIYEMAIKRNPDVTVTSFLYFNYMPAPLGDIKLNPNIYGEFVPWGNKTAFHPMTEEMVEWLRNQWVGWQKTGITMAYRPNYFHGGYVMPQLCTRQCGEFLQFAWQHGMVGVNFDSLFGHWATRGPMLYMHFRLFDNPELSIDEILDEYYSGFGAAAKFVREYFEYWEEKSAGIVARGGHLYNPVVAHKFYPSEIFLPADDMLARASASVQGSENKLFHQRIEFLQAGLEHARMAARFTSFLDYGPAFIRNWGIEEYVPVEIRNPERFAACQKALQELIAFRRAHEHLYISDYVDAAKREDRRVDIKSLLDVK